MKLTIDQGTAYRIPYIWCFTNTCIAADAADPRLLNEMETGEKLLLEVVDSSLLTVSTSLPLDQFATVRQGLRRERLSKPSTSDRASRRTPGRLSTPDRPTLFRPARAALSLKMASSNRQYTRTPSRPCG